MRLPELASAMGFAPEADPTVLFSTLHYTTCSPVIVSLLSSTRTEQLNHVFCKQPVYTWFRAFSLSLLLSACTAPSDSTDSVTTQPSTVRPSTQRAARIDAKNGFRDHHFGDDLRTF